MVSVFYFLSPTWLDYIKMDRALSTGRSDFHIDRSRVGGKRRPRAPPADKAMI